MKFIKPIELIIFLCLALNTPALQAQSDSFEGKLYFRTETYFKDYEENAGITWYIKQGEQRLDYNISGKYKKTYTIIMRNNIADMYYMNNGKMAIIPLNPVNAVLESYTINNRETNVKVGVFNCTKYSLIVNGGEIDIWISDLVQPSLKVFPEFMQKGYLRIAASLDAKGFPVKIIKKDNSGRVVFAQTLMSISTENTSEDVFNIEQLQEAK